ncbi:hypothetical protein GJAV_G00043840 [Gymnothorax javanicus]|nr:hypothetical protein GJAV_G00043840 [Gymnothorax javanicus]
MSVTTTHPSVRGHDMHQVLASFPLSQLTEEDLSQNPQFCRLLAALSQRVDHTGLSLPLKRELEKAEQELQVQRLGWLRSESLFRLLQEMLQEHCVRKHHSSTTADDDKLYETLEQCLLVAQCAHQLDPSSIVGQDQPLLLGLSAQQVLGQMPPEQDVNSMKQWLPAELEKHLKRKCMAILTYYDPDCEEESERLKGLKLSRLPETLENEGKRAESLGENNRTNAALLQKQTHCYLSELLGCIQILQSIIVDHRLKAQKELDTKTVEYLDAKCEILLHKIRVDMLELQLETYTPEKIAAHREIRGKLDIKLGTAQAEKQSAESTLSSFQMLGQEFETLVEEYSRLRLEIDNKRWALKEFSSTVPEAGGPLSS